MEFAIRMMLAVAAFFTLLLSFLGTLYWRKRRTYAGCGRQTIANLLFALCLLLLALRPVLPDWISIVGANAVVAAAAILSLEAAREFRGLRPQVFPVYIGGILAVLAVVYFDYVVSNINARIVVMSAFMGVTALLSSVTLFQEKRTLAVSVTGGMFAMSAALLMARAIYFLFAPPLADLLSISWVNGAFFVGCSLSIACCSIAWKEVIDERVLMDMREADSRTGRASHGVAEATERAGSMGAFAWAGWHLGQDTAALSEMNAGERKRGQEESRRIQAQRMNLPAKLVQAQETERRLLARELHDNFGQTLAALSMEASVLPKAAPELPDVINQRSLGLAKKIGDLADDVHRMSQQIHPLILDDLGVEAALEGECTHFSQRLGIRVRFKAQDVPRSLPEDAALCLFRVAQESLLNIEKHADAKRVHVLLAGGKADVALFIEDSGNGFSVEQVRETGGLGLIGMEERVRLLNGDFQIRSQPGEGTKVEVHVPLPEQASTLDIASA